MFLTLEMLGTTLKQVYGRGQVSKLQCWPYLLPHNFRVRPINKYGVGKPTQHELEVRFAGLDVRGITGIFRLCPLDIQSDADLR